jgi:hypothetical protein
VEPERVLESSSAVSKKKHVNRVSFSRRLAVMAPIQDYMRQEFIRSISSMNLEAPAGNPSISPRPHPSDSAMGLHDEAMDLGTVAEAANRYSSTEWRPLGIAFVNRHSAESDASRCTHVLQQTQMPASMIVSARQPASLSMATATPVPAASSWANNSPPPDQIALPPAEASPPDGPP